MTEFVWRVHMLVPADQVENAADLAAAVLPGGAAERCMFGVPISADRGDTSPASYYGCSTLLTDAQYRRLREALLNASVACRWVALRANDQSHAVEASGMDATAGEPWSWEKTLVAVLDSRGRG